MQLHDGVKRNVNDVCVTNDVCRYAVGLEGKPMSQVLQLLVQCEIVTFDDAARSMQNCDI